MTGERFINLAHIKSQTRCWLIVICLLANVSHCNPPRSDHRPANNQHAFAPVAASASDDILHFLPPRITTHHDRELSRSSDGSPMPLTCRADGIPPPIVTWYDVSNLAETEHKVQNGTYEESQINVSSGYYQCRATNDNGTAISDVTHVTIYSTDESQWSVPTHQKVVNGVVGGSVVLEFCTVTGKVPEWSPKWRNECQFNPDNEDINSADKNFAITEHGDLVILNLRLDSERCYISRFYFYKMAKRIVCATTKLNITADTRRTDTSDVDTRATRLVYKSKNKTMLDGHNATLMCVFSGRIPPAITWSRKSGRPVRGNVSEFGRKLVLAAVREEDQDEYVCSAGDAVGHIHLSVVVVPRIITSLLSRNVTYGQSVDFTCNVVSKPNSKVTWFINGVNNVQSGVSVTNEAAGLFSLKFQAVHSSFGIACNVSNEYGYDFSSASVGLDIVPSYSPTTTLGTNTAALDRVVGQQTNGPLTAAGASLFIVICVAVVVVGVTVAVILILVCRRLNRHQRERREESSGDKTVAQEDDSMLEKPPPDVERVSLASGDHHSSLSEISSRFPSTDSGIAWAPDENSAMADNIENMARDRKLLAAEEDVDDL